MQRKSHGRVRQNFRQKSERSHRPDEDLCAFTSPRNDPHRNHGTRHQAPHYMHLRARQHQMCFGNTMREKNEENERKCSGKARRVRQNFRHKSERSHRPDEDLRAFTTLCSHTHHCVDSMQVCGILQLLAEPSRISGRWLPTCFPLRARHECMRPSTAGRTMGDSEHTPRLERCGQVGMRASCVCGQAGGEGARGISRRR